MDPQKNKYHKLYMDLAIRCSEESVDRRRKVGCIIVTNTGLMAQGWNGTPAGVDNVCDDWDDNVEGGRFVTRPEVVHAERNALDKLSKEGVVAKDSIVFVTLSPCLECAKSLHGVGVREVWYLTAKRDRRGLDFFEKVGLSCKQFV